MRHCRDCWPRPRSMISRTNPVAFWVAAMSVTTILGKTHGGIRNGNESRLTAGFGIWPPRYRSGWAKPKSIRPPGGLPRKRGRRKTTGLPSYKRGECYPVSLPICFIISDAAQMQSMDEYPIEDFDYKRISDMSVDEVKEMAGTTFAPFY